MYHACEPRNRQVKAWRIHCISTVRLTKVKNPMAGSAVEKCRHHSHWVVRKPGSPVGASYAIAHTRH